MAWRWQWSARDRALYAGWLRQRELRRQQAARRDDDDPEDAA
jgi:hypothetical protein